MLRILRKLSGKNVAFVFVCALFIFAQVWLDLTLPDYMSEITMLLQTQGSQMSEILKAGAMMLLCALGSLVCSVVVSVFVAAIAADFSASLRTHLFNKVQSFSMAEIGNFSTPSLITRSTNDVMQVQMLLVMGMQVLIKAPVTAVWAIIKISDKSSEWTITTAVAVVVLFIIIGTCIALSMPKFRKLQRLTDDVNRVTRENLTGIRVVRAYNAESYQQDKFESVNDELTRANVFTARVMSTMMPSITLVNNMLVLSVYFIGAVIIDRAALADKAQLFSDMLVFSSYAMQIVMSFMMLVMIFILQSPGHLHKLASHALRGKPETETGHLHGDGRAALTAASRENVGKRGTGNTHEFDARVLVKAVVFGGKHCIAHKARNFVKAYKIATLFAVFADQGAVGTPDAQRYFWLVFRQRVDGRQLGVHHRKNDHKKACAAHGCGQADAGQATEPLEPAAGFGFGFLRGHGTGTMASRRTSRFLEKHVFKLD